MRDEELSDEALTPRERVVFVATCQLAERESDDERELLFLDDDYVAEAERLAELRWLYIHDNTDDEFSDADFINAYLEAHGKQTVNLDQFRTLPSSQADGAQQIGRLTNLMQLTVNTSFWTRYRSDTQNPERVDTLPHEVRSWRSASTRGSPKQW